VRSELSVWEVSIAMQASSPSLNNLQPPSPTPTQSVPVAAVAAPVQYAAAVVVKTEIFEDFEKSLAELPEHAVDDDDELGANAAGDEDEVYTGEDTLPWGLDVAGGDIEFADDLDIDSMAMSDDEKHESASASGSSCKSSGSSRWGPWSSAGKVPRPPQNPPSPRLVAKARRPGMVAPRPKKMPKKTVLLQPKPSTRADSVQPKPSCILRSPRAGPRPMLAKAPSRFDIVRPSSYAGKGSKLAAPPIELRVSAPS
jgi:hypothetical protein